METIRTEIKLHQFYEEMKEPLAFDEFQDFSDFVIRQGLEYLQRAVITKLQLQEGIAARSLP
jgi:hypothetical protein